MNAPIVATPDRSKFLGGTDAAAVMGVSPWATPVELWREKRGEAPPDTPDPMRQRMFDRGRKLEPFIREMVIDKLRDRGHQVELIACNQRYIDPEHDFLSCEIDFELLLDGVHINADAKSVTGFARKKWGEEDTEDVPIEYAAQFMHGLMVTGRGRCLVAALRSFDDVDIYWVNRDDETIAAMRPKLVSFWIDHVMGGTTPDPFTFNDIKILFPLDNGLAVDADEEMAAKVEQLRQIKARIKEFEDAEEALKFEIAEAISPHTTLRFDGRDIATWKGQSVTRLDQEALRSARPQVFAEFSRTSVQRVLRLPKRGKR